MVSGDVGYRVMYILAFIGAAPASVLGILFIEEAVNDLVLTEVGETNAMVVLAAVAAVFVFATIFTMVRYPVPRESALGLWVGLFSSALSSIILWVWLSLEFEYELPLLKLSEFYTIATLTFLDILLGCVAILVALVAATERI